MIQPDMSENATRTRRSNVMAFISFGLALVASAGLLLAPSGERQESSCAVTASGLGTASTDQPACVDTVSRVSLLQEEGIGVVLVLAIPVMVAGIALALQWTRWARPAAVTAGTLLVAFSVLGLASIGLFYLPSGIAMLLASTHPRQPSGTT
jgi:hypothetical protein